MRCFLITGAAGFIGAHFTRYLLEAYPDSQLILVDALTYAGDVQRLEECLGSARVRLFQLDIADAARMQAVFAAAQPDCVVNLAAESHVDRSLSEPAAFVRSNVAGTQVLLDLARSAGVRRFLQVSTDEVYGPAPPGVHFDETSALRPSSPYSASKAAADLLVLAYHRSFGLPVNITRCTNNYGPGQFPEKLIPLMIAQALDDQPLPVYGDGRQVRDWIHVEDHCAALDAVLRRGRSGEVYNIGADDEWENIEVVREILTFLHKPESLIRHVADRPGHDRRYAIDSTKLRRETGWAPRRTFRTGLAETIRWYIEHRDWWERMRERAAPVRPAVVARGAVE
ncbi:MAG TPA: dTDP-glucose 4,6-dehydratase [Limnochordia bacterium]